jgi:hypothetical protein
MPQLWQQFGQRRTALLDRVAHQVGDLLAARPAHGRDENGDDAIFAPLGVQTTLAFHRGAFALAVAMYRRCMQLADEYEAAHPGAELHRGTPAFNAGLAFLRSYDFTAALHYFELAQREMRRTTGSDGWNLFQGPVFTAQFWDTIGAAANTYLIPLYEQFWGRPFSQATSRANWQRISRHSKLSYIVASAQRVRYRLLVDQSGLASSRSLALAYWLLNADLARLLETEVHRRAKVPPPAPKPHTLFPLLTQGYINTPVGNVSASIGRSTASTASTALQHSMTPSRRSARRSSTRRCHVSIASTEPSTCSTPRATRCSTTSIAGCSSTARSLRRRSRRMSCSRFAAWTPGRS